jgi:hypothetical protein
MIYKHIVVLEKIVRGLPSLSALVQTLELLVPVGLSRRLAVGGLGSRLPALLQ